MTESSFDHERLRFEREFAHRRSYIDMLRHIARTDATVSFFIKSWESGRCVSFEQMMVEMACQLATEKEGYLEAATKAIVTSPTQTVIVTEESMDQLRERVGSSVLPNKDMGKKEAARPPKPTPPPPPPKK